jgi:putative ABC transport system substrate-binding protein
VASAAAWPLSARAQGAGIIGFMHVASPAAMSHLVAAFRQGLKDSGVAEPEIAIEFRWAEGAYDRLNGFAEDLVARRVGLIVTGGGPIPALAAKAATSTIPIVFNIGDDPVKLGLVASVSRPGGNATGVNILTAEIATKRLSLLHDILPRGVPVGYLFNPRFSPATDLTGAVTEAARTIGREIVLLQASTAAEIDTVFSSLPRGLGGLLVAADPFFYARRDQIVQWTTRLSLPACFEQREYVLAGGLMSYSTSITDSYRQMGLYAARILKGEKPADLPVVHSTKFELAVNMKTVRALGLTLPSGLASIVDELIE